MIEKAEEVLVKVNKIKTGVDAETVLVEWVEDGSVRRGFIPFKKFSLDGVPMSVLSKSTPYGLPWAQLVTFSATPEGLEKALHNADVWTLDDLVTKPQQVIGALQTAYHIDSAALRTAAKNYGLEVKK